MISEIKEEKGLKRKLEFTIPLEDVEKSFSSEFQKIQKNTQIAGFREGKAPMEAVKQSYYQKGWQAVMDDLFKNHYPKALQNTKLNPVSQPTLLNVTLEEKKPCTFLVELEVHPKIEVNNYLKLKIKKNDTTVTDKDIDQAIEQLQDSFANYQDSLEVRPIKKDDWITINLKGSLHGQDVKELTHKELLLKLGENKIAPDFDNHLMGLKAGEEKSFDFLFSKEHFYKSIAGQKVTLQVQIQKLKSKITPELNDEFAKKFKIDTFSELKGKIKEDIDKNKKQKAKETTENEIVTQLVESNPLEVPESLIKNQKQSLIENARRRLKEYGMKPHEEEKWIKEQNASFDTEAQFSVKSGYLVEQLVQDLKMEATKEDIEKSLKESFPSKSPSEMEQELKKNHYWQQFLFSLNRQKVISFLIEKADAS